MEGHKKRVAWLFVCAAVLAAVVAGSAIARTDRVGAGTLNVYGYGPGDDIQENRAAYAASQLSGTDIKRPAGDFNDQVFLTRLASGDVPDLVRMTRPRVAQYAAKGVLQPMDSCVNPVKKQYRVGAMKAMTYKGHVYGFPEFTNQVTLVVNASAFKDAGVPISAAQTKNKKALLATAKKLTKFDSSGNPTRIGFDPKIDSGFGFYMWVKWFGDDVISKDGLHAKLNTPHAISALSYAISIINAEGGWNKFKAFRDTWDFFGKQADQKTYNDVYQSFGHPQFDNAVRTLVHASRYGFELPPSPGGQQFVQAVTDAVNRALSGQQSPKQALNQAQREAQKAINDNK